MCWFVYVQQERNTPKRSIGYWGHDRRYSRAGSYSLLGRHQSSHFAVFARRPRDKYSDKGPVVYSPQSRLLVPDIPEKTAVNQAVRLDARRAGSIRRASVRRRRLGTKRKTPAT